MFEDIKLKDCECDNLLTKFDGLLNKIICSCPGILTSKLGMIKKVYYPKQNLKNRIQNEEEKEHKVTNTRT